MKIITWNSEGLKAGSIKSILGKGKPDVLFVQEGGNLEPYAELNGLAPSMETAYKIIGAEVLPNGYTGWWCPWVRTAATGNIRCSLAMFWKTTLAYAVGAPTIIKSEPDDKRPVMRKLLGNINFYNLHAGGRAYINEVLSIGKRSGHHYLVAGDFNQEASTLSGVCTVPEGAHVHATTGTDYTRPKSRKIIDYAVSSIPEGVASLYSTSYYGDSDHKVVEVIWP